MFWGFGTPRADLISPRDYFFSVGNVVSELLSSLGLKQRESKVCEKKYTSYNWENMRIITGHCVGQKQILDDMRYEKYGKFSLCTDRMHHPDKEALLYPHLEKKEKGPINANKMRRILNAIWNSGFILEINRTLVEKLANSE